MTIACRPHQGPADTSMARPRAVLWDWDNTLVDGWPTITMALNAAFARFGMPSWTVAETRSRVRHSLRDSFPGLFGEAWPLARDTFYAAFAERHLAEVRLLDGAQAALDAAGDAWQAVVSNKSGRFLRAEAAHLGVAGRFGMLVGAGDAAADKPDPAAIRLGLAGRPGGTDVWYVGDTRLDMDAARAAGCLAVLVGPADHDGGPTHCAPDLHFADLRSLAAALASAGTVTG